MLIIPQLERRRSEVKRVAGLWWMFSRDSFGVNFTVHLHSHPDKLTWSSVPTCLIIWLQLINQWFTGLSREKVVDQTRHLRRLCETLIRIKFKISWHFIDQTTIHPDVAVCQLLICKIYHPNWGKFWWSSFSRCYIFSLSDRTLNHSTSVQTQMSHAVFSHAVRNTATKDSFLSS